MLRAYAALVVLGIVWGTNFIYMKWATDLISPTQTVFLRVFFGFLPLLVLACQSARNPAPRSASNFDPPFG